MGVETVLTLSKSIPVKSQVPIQVLLEEEGTEPERSPWEDLPPTNQTYIILISASPVIGQHGCPNERSNPALLVEAAAGVAHDPPAHTHTGSNTLKMNSSRANCWLWSLL